MHVRDVETQTGLSTVEQLARARAAHTWAARILALMSVSGCAAVWAVRAVEGSDED
jgi:hypothetical protein